MDAVLFLKELDRATKNCDIDCMSCPLCIENNEKNKPCSDLTEEENVEIIEKWSREHPIKTMMDDFFEKFPNAPKQLRGIPRICPYNCGYVVDDWCEGDCLKCWSRPLEVKE